MKYKTCLVLCKNTCEHFKAGIKLQKPQNIKLFFSILSKMLSFDSIMLMKKGTLKSLLFPRQFKIFNLKLIICFILSSIFLYIPIIPLTFWNWWRNVGQFRCKTPSFEQILLFAPKLIKASLLNDHICFSLSHCLVAHTNYFTLFVILI